MPDHPDDDVPDPEHNPAPDDVPESEGNPAPNDVLNSEQVLYEPAPADWRTLAALSVDQLEREMRELHTVWDRHSYMAWLSIMQIIPRIRAYKEHCGGEAFAAKCKMLCRVGKTAAYNIVRWRIAEPEILNKIWERVHAEADAASVRGDRYEYPALNRMCSWYKPEDEVPDDASEEDEEELQNVLTGAGSEEPSNDPRSNDEPSNDKRSRAEIAKQNIMLEDHNKTLTRKQTLLEQRLADRDTEIDQLSRRANEQRESLAQLQELINQLKARLAAKDAEISARDAEIAAKDAEISARDAEIAASNAEIITRDAQIAASNAEIAAKDTEIAYLRAVARRTHEPDPEPEPPEPPPEPPPQV